MNAATFVLSTGRCGTQWLSKNLAGHYGDLLAAVHEPHHREYLPRWLLGIVHPRQWPTIGLIDRHIAAIEKDLATRSYLECGWPCYGALPYFARRLGGRMRVVHLVRHPVPSAASMVTHLYYHDRPDGLTEKALLTPTDAGAAMPDYAGRWAGLSRFEKCLYFWGEIGLLGLRWERELGVPWLRLRSEDLFGADGLDRLLDFIGVPRRPPIYAARNTQFDAYVMGTRVRLEAQARSIGEHPRIIALARQLGYDALAVDTQQLKARYEFDPGPGVPGGPQWLPQWTTVSRNAPCPCGSGRKYKHCHGAAA
jgi:hypothetical protein